MTVRRLLKRSTFRSASGGKALQIRPNQCENPLQYAHLAAPQQIRHIPHVYLYLMVGIIIFLQS